MGVNIILIFFSKDEKVIYFLDQFANCRDKLETYSDIYAKSKWNDISLVAY